MSDFSVGGRGAGLACSRASSLVKNAVSTLVPERWDARLATERCEGVTERAIGRHHEQPLAWLIQRDGRVVGCQRQPL